MATPATGKLPMIQGLRLGIVCTRPGYPQKWKYFDRWPTRKEMEANAGKCAIFRGDEKRHARAAEVPHKFIWSDYMQVIPGRANDLVMYHVEREQRGTRTVRWWEAELPETETANTRMMEVMFSRHMDALGLPMTAQQADAEAKQAAAQREFRSSWADRMEREAGPVPRTTPQKLRDAGYGLLVLEQPSGDPYFVSVPAWGALSHSDHIKVMIGTPRGIEQYKRDPRKAGKFFKPETDPSIVFFVHLNRYTNVDMRMADAENTYTPEWVNVDPDFRRMGWAKAAWDYIKRMIEKQTGLKVRHSYARTGMGQAWVSGLPRQLAAGRIRTFDQYLAEGMWDTTEEDEDYGASAETVAQSVAREFNRWWYHAHVSTSYLDWEVEKQPMWPMNRCAVWASAPVSDVWSDVESRPPGLRRATVAEIVVLRDPYRGNFSCKYSADPEVPGGAGMLGAMRGVLGRVDVPDMPPTWSQARQVKWR